MNTMKREYAPKELFAIQKADVVMLDLHALRYPEQHQVVAYVEPSRLAVINGLPTGWITTAEALMLDNTASATTKAQEIQGQFSTVARYLARTKAENRPMQIVDFFKVAAEETEFFARFSVEGSSDPVNDILPPTDVLDQMFNYALLKRAKKVGGLIRFIEQISRI